MDACRARGAKLCGSMRSSVSAWIHSFWAQRLARITRNAHLLGAPKVLVVPIAGANSPHLPPRLDLGRLSPLRHAVLPTEPGLGDVAFISLVFAPLVRNWMPFISGGPTGRTGILGSNNRIERPNLLNAWEIEAAHLFWIG